MGEQKALGKTPLGGNPSPEMTYLPTYLCTRHSFPPSPVREMREGVPGRPQLPSGAVFSCNLTGEPIGLESSSFWPPSSVCRG